MKRSLIIIPLLLISVLYLFGGCSKEVKGPERVNVPPTVKFVNIPVERARLSADTTIFWTGTDIDGYITKYRYAAVESTVVSDPEIFLNSDRTGFTVDDSLVNWNEIEVTTQNTGTNDQVRMSADVSDPVRKYVTSYVFLQAIDNLGAKSEIVYRAFLRNNHFPNTFINANPRTVPYINAKSPNGILDGVSVSFSAEDPIDHEIGEEPPFEYRWKLFGPFSDSIYNELMANYVDSVFMDNFGDFYRVGETLNIYLGLDTTIDSSGTPYDTTFDSSFNKIAVNDIFGSNQFGAWNDVLLGVEPSLDSLILDSADHAGITAREILNNNLVDSSSGFSYAAEANVYDIFSKQQVTAAEDTTRLMNFIFWAQCRDDARTPDKIPGYQFISAIEPKYERDVLVLDAARYINTSAFNYPINPARTPWRGDPAYEDSFMVRNVYGDYINNWKNGSYDAVNVLTNIVRNGELMQYEKFGCTEDYYAFAVLEKEDATGVTLREIMKHKVVILVKDATDNTVQLATKSGDALLKAVNAGLSCWVMARAGAGAGFIEEGGIPIMTSEFPNYFGVDYLVTDDWQRRTGAGIPTNRPRFEDFVGAGDILTDNIDLPDLIIDTTLLKTRYWWDTLGYPYTYYPVSAPTVWDTVTSIFDTVSTDPLVIDSIFVYFPKVHNGKLTAGGPDSGYAALPEVGYIVRTAQATPLYLYRSIYEEYNIPWYSQVREENTGSVVAVRVDESVFRTAYFNFTLVALDPVTGQQMFNSMMDWLTDQPFIQTGKLRPGSSGPFDNDNLRKFKEYDRIIDQRRIEAARRIHGDSK